MMRLAGALKNLVKEEWVAEGEAWFVESDEPSLTIYWLAPSGRQELTQREKLAGDHGEPIVLTRDELVAQLQQRFGWSDEYVAHNPTLRDSTYRYWPSIGAYAGYNPS